MTSGEERALHARLDELRLLTERRSLGLRDSFNDIVDASSDVATDDEHDPEGHTIAWERQQLSALLSQALTELEEIAAAKRRLDDGTYGTCAACGSDISPDRLEALPTTATCIDCPPIGTSQSS